MSIISGPPQQAANTSSFDDIQLVSITFGWLLGFSILTALHAGVQTLKAWRRVGRVTAYAIMVWVNIVVCMVFGILCWLCAHGTIREDFTFFFLGTTMRCIIIQLTVQILTNRISILVPSARTKRLLKWGPFAVEFILNVGVYCIWIPAHLSLREPWLTINNVYARTEKAIYMLLDLGLNLYFCHLVKSRLVDAGIRKYRSLYRFNMTILVLGISLDLLLIGLMSLKNPLVYVQFYPVIFMGKLNIEMYMADEIAKIAQSRNIEKLPEHVTCARRSHIGRSGDNSFNSAMSSLRTDSSRRELNSALRTREMMEQTVDPGRAHSGHNRSRRSPHNCLYHAWISGGNKSQGHIVQADTATSNRLGGVMAEKDLESACVSNSKRRSENVITKHTSVLVSAESGASSCVQDGQRSSGAGEPWQM